MLQQQLYLSFDSASAMPSALAQRPYPMPDCMQLARASTPPWMNEMMMLCAASEDLVARQRSANANERLRVDAYRRTSSIYTRDYLPDPRLSYSFQDQRSTEALPCPFSAPYNWRNHVRSVPMPLSQGPMKLDVDWNLDNLSAALSWTLPEFCSPLLINWQISVYSDEPQPQPIQSITKNGLCNSYVFVVVSGRKYRVLVEAVDFVTSASRRVILRGGVGFKTGGFAEDEMLRLLRLAEDCIGEEMEAFENFYRDKPNEYWNRMAASTGHIMPPYLKDDNGHSASPINGIIHGLFFNCKLLYGKLPKTSVFGDRRLILPAQYLWAPGTRLYFADFYCNSSEDGCFGAGIHYVTIVITQRGSRCDDYCQRTLVELDPWCNKFLCLFEDLLTGRVFFRVNANRGVWVEAYYTEAVDVRFGHFCPVEGKGQSRPNGVDNNKFCRTCNLYPLTPTPQELAKIVAGGRIHNGRIAAGKRKLNEDDPAAKRRKIDETAENPSPSLDAVSSSNSERGNSPDSGVASEADGSELQDAFSGTFGITADESTKAVIEAYSSSQLNARRQVVAKRRVPRTSVVEDHASEPAPSSLSVSDSTVPTSAKDKGLAAATFSVAPFLAACSASSPRSPFKLVFEEDESGVNEPFLILDSIDEPADLPSSHKSQEGNDNSSCADVQPLTESAGDFKEKELPTPKIEARETMANITHRRSSSSSSLLDEEDLLGFNDSGDLNAPEADISAENIENESWILFADSQPEKKIG